MRIRLPYVFEFDYVVHGGRSIRSENLKSYIDVDVQAVDRLARDVVFAHRGRRLALWNGRLYRPWLRTDEAGVQARIDEFLRLGRRWQLVCLGGGRVFPIPPYMRTRRMAFESPTSRRFAADQGVPLNASLVYRRANEERAEEARAFYQSAFVSSQGQLWMLAEEPVWQLRFATAEELRGIDEPTPPREAYRAELELNADFRLAHRQFRLDRYGDGAWDFVIEGLQSLLLERSGRPHRGGGAAVLARHDIVQLAACTLDFLVPAREELDLSGLFAMEPIAVATAIMRAKELVAQQDERELGLRDWPKFQILRERWAFEDSRPAGLPAGVAELIESDTTPELDQLRAVGD
jgi:hypothetical protein